MKLLQEKDGIRVYRTADGVLKCFDNEVNRREIGNYKLLSRLKIPTLNVLEFNDNSILLEDITVSDTWRLAVESDMNDTDIAAKLALWYKQLHTLGKSAVGEIAYDENDVITRENLDFIKIKTHTESNPVWELLSDKFDDLRKMIDDTAKTLTYNDFYYTNMAVGESSVLMFDYNLLGKGYAYADVRNVTSSLGDEAAVVFRREYGEVDPAEIAVDEVASTLVTVYYACKRDIFPSWGENELTKIHDGSLYRNFTASLTVSSRL